MRTSLFINLISKQAMKYFNFSSISHKMPMIALLFILSNAIHSQDLKKINLIEKSVYSIMFINEQDIVERKNMANVHNATAFLLPYKGRLFLACAKHSVEKFYNSDSPILYSIALSKDSVIYQRGFIYYDTSSADVALIQPINFPGLPKIKYFNTDNILFLDNQNLPLLSELYLFGYPTYNTGDMTSVYRSIDETGSYNPFLKKGFICGYDKSDTNNFRYLLDINLSKGYSGGPAYYFDSSGKIYLAGVITNSAISNIIDERHQTINNLYQTGEMAVITDARYLLVILNKIVK